ncbi:holin [Erwinia phage Gungnir39]|nr:holin [Erwinia phage Gungnir39]
MYRMNPTDGNNLPYWWSSLLAGFSLLSLQDYVFIIGALLSAFFTIKTYYAKRKEERDRLEEEKKRTMLLEKYLAEAHARGDHDPEKSAAVIDEAMGRVGYVSN